MSEPATSEDAAQPATSPPPQAPEATPSAADAAAATATNPLLKKLGEYKEFIAIIVAAATGLWLAVDYFVTRERFADVMILNQCQLFGNVAKLSQQINDNHYKYMSDWTFEQIFPYQQKKFQNIALAKDEARRMEELQTALDVIKKQADASAASAKIFDDALKTGNCAKLITFQK